MTYKPWHVIIKIVKKYKSEKELMKMFKLENKVELIVPKEDNNGVEIDNLAIREELENITKICGGCTTTDVKGQWWSDNEQRIMQDNNTNFEWYYDKDMQDMNDQQGLLKVSVIEIGRAHV